MPSLTIAYCIVRLTGRPYVLDAAVIGTCSFTKQRWVSRGLNQRSQEVNKEMNKSSDDILSPWGEFVNSFLFGQRAEGLLW